MRQGKWLKGDLAPQTFMLSGKTVGIVGFGHIGKALAERLRGFGVTLLVTTRTPQPEEEARLGVTRVSLEGMLPQVDVLVLCCPLTEETRGLINAAALARMKRRAVLINVARGGVVEEDALAAALAAGTIAGAALDVFAQEPPPDHPLLHSDKVVITPHLAGACGDNAPRELAQIFGNIARVAAGEPIPERDRVV
jgi:phosphoglycerate dehydrogenase-like enzyme